MSSSTSRTSATRSWRRFSSLKAEAGFAAALIAALVMLLLLVALAFAVGAYPITLDDLLTALHMKPVTAPLSSAAETIIWEIRGPRILGAILVGAALASAGSAYQSLFRNPLVSPDILGVSSGAALGAVLGIYFALPVAGIEALSFAGGVVAVLLVYTIAASISLRDPVLVLVLTGVVIGALLASGIALLKFLADPQNQLPAITFWLLGSLAAFNRADLAVLAPTALIALLPLVLLRWRLDVLSLGEEEASALGVDVRRLRIVIIIAATLMTSAAVAVSGIVGWVGLLIPHLARLIVGPAFARLLPMTILVGAAYLLAVDTAARIVGPTEIPLGVLTAVIGTPVFLLLLARGRRGGW